MLPCVFGVTAWSLVVFFAVRLFILLCKQVETLSLTLLLILHFNAIFQWVRWWSSPFVYYFEWNTIFCWKSSYSRSFLAARVICLVRYPGKLLVLYVWSRTWDQLNHAGAQWICKLYFCYCIHLDNLLFTCSRWYGWSDCLRQFALIYGLHLHYYAEQLSGTCD